MGKYIVCRCGEIFGYKDFVSHRYEQYEDKYGYGVRNRVGHSIGFISCDIEYVEKLDRYRCLRCGRIISMKKKHGC